MGEGKEVNKPLSKRSETHNNAKGHWRSVRGSNWLIRNSIARVSIGSGREIIFGGRYQSTWARPVFPFWFQRERKVAERLQEQRRICGEGDDSRTGRERLYAYRYKHYAKEKVYVFRSELSEAEADKCGIKWLITLDHMPQNFWDRSRRGSLGKKRSKTDMIEEEEQPRPASTNTPEWHAKQRHQAVRKGESGSYERWVGCMLDGWPRHASTSHPSYCCLHLSKLALLSALECGISGMQSHGRMKR